MLRDDQCDISFASLNLLQGSLTGRLLASENEVTRGLDAVDELLRLRGAVIIDHLHTDVLHLHVHHPRHDAHNQHREHHDEPWQKRVAAYLQELLLD